MQVKYKYHITRGRIPSTDEYEDIVDHDQVGDDDDAQLTFTVIAGW